MTESFSGVRGIWEKDLCKSHIINYTDAFSIFLERESLTERKTVVVGRDSRESGKIISELFINRLRENGISIIDVDIQATPIIQNAVRAFKASGGIIITASHNPPEYNGFKLLERRGNVLYPEDMLYVINQSKHTIKFAKKTLGEYELKSHDSVSKYVDFIENIMRERKILNLFDGKKINVLLDPNGGAITHTGQSILKRFKIQTKEINNELSKFTRSIEPNRKSLEYLQKIVINEKFDLAAGFDCDADRIELVSARRGVISGQYVLGLLTKYLATKESTITSKNIVVNDATSYLVKDTLPKSFNWIETEVGEVNIIKEHDKNSTNFGGEGSSGGVIIPPSRSRDGILTLLFVIAYLYESGQTLDQAIDLLPQYETLTKKIKTATKWTDIRVKLLNMIRANNLSFQATGGEDGGVKIVYNDGWLWFRGSKTEDNIIRIMSDSKKIETANKLILHGEKILKDIV